jgi:predicted PurR-regulated permease PerM
MPAPAIIGIPFLASVAGGFVAYLLDFFMQFFTKRVAIIFAAVTAIAALTAGLFAAITSLISGLYVSLPPDLAQGVRMIAPSNLEACLTAIASGHVARYVYEWQVKVIQYKFAF